MHRRRPNLSGKLRFIVPQSDSHPLFILVDYKCPDFYSCLGTVPQLVLPVMEVADISACIPQTIPTLHFSCGLVTAKGCIRQGTFLIISQSAFTQIAPVSPQNRRLPIRGFSGYPTHSDSGKVARILGISHRAVLACPLFNGVAAVWAALGRCPAP